MTRFVRGIVGVGLIWTLGCGDEGEPQPGDTGDAGAGGEDFTAFDARFEQYLVENSLAGGAAVVVHKERGVLHESAYGEFSLDRFYLMASGTKVLSVGVIMRLVDQGLLDIDKPISDYLSAWGEHKSDISAASLLSNSSGLVSLTDDPMYPLYLCQYIPTGSLSTCAKQIYSVDDSADRKPVDKAFAYGGGQWQLAGGLAEVVSGKSWAQLVDETYVQPCGATSLGYNNHYSRASDGGSPYAYPSFFMSNPANLGDTANPSIEGGAYIKVSDYGKLLALHLSGGRCGDQQVLSSDSVARMQEDRIAEVYDGSTTSPTLEGYGLGWWVDRKHPGVFVDPGLYGAVAWLDLTHDYGAFIALEATSKQGEALRAELQPLVEAALEP